VLYLRYQVERAVFLTFKRLIGVSLPRRHILEID